MDYIYSTKHTLNGLVATNWRRPTKEEYFDGSGQRVQKRNRNNYERDPYSYKDRRMDSSRNPRYGGVRKETFLHGSYSDYMREFHQRPPTHNMATPHPMAQYGPPPGYYDQNSYNPHQYDRSTRGGYGMAPTQDYGSHTSHSNHASHSSQRSAEATNKRSYERDVDDFLRRTAHGLRQRSRGEESRSSHREERSSHRGDHERGRERDRSERERGEREHRERDYRSEREYRSERDYDRRDYEREKERSSRHHRERR